MSARAGWWKVTVASAGVLTLLSGLAAARPGGEGDDGPPDRDDAPPKKERPRDRDRGDEPPPPEKGHPGRRPPRSGPDGDDRNPDRPPPRRMHPPGPGPGDDRDGPPPRRSRVRPRVVRLEPRATTVLPLAGRLADQKTALRVPRRVIVTVAPLENAIATAATIRGKVLARERTVPSRDAVRVTMKTARRPLRADLVDRLTAVPTATAMTTDRRLRPVVG